MDDLALTAGGEEAGPDNDGNDATDPNIILLEIVVQMNYRL